MGLNILSLFDGIGGGRIALDRANIQIDNYYASEICDYSIAGVIISISKNLRRWVR